MDKPELLQKLLFITSSQVDTTDDFSEEIIKVYKEIKDDFTHCSPVDRQQALDMLNTTLHTLAKQRRERGVSNFIFFMLLKLQKYLKQNLRKRPEPINLSEDTAYEFYNQTKMLSRLPIIPSSPEEYLFIAKKSKYFKWKTEIGFFYPTIPVMFALNYDAFLSWQRDKNAFNLSTGHCITGFSPTEDKVQALDISIKGGLLLNDFFVYQHVQTIQMELEKFIRNTYVNLDTLYYLHKLKESLPGKYKINTPMYIDKIIHNQVRSIRQLLPNAILCREDDLTFQKLYDKIINELGLFEFIVDKVKSFRGINLKEENTFAHSLSYVAATYLYSPLILGVPGVSIESSLNIEVPSLIVLPFLESINLQHLFCFIGLFPLPDIKISNGSMTYGDANDGKVFMNDNRTLILSKTKNFHKNWTIPYRCWYTTYFLAYGNSIPDKLCEEQRCNFHANILKTSLVNDVFKLPKTDVEIEF